MAQIHVRVCKDRRIHTTDVSQHYKDCKLNGSHPTVCNHATSPTDPQHQFSHCMQCLQFPPSRTLLPPGLPASPPHHGPRPAESAGQLPGNGSPASPAALPAPAAQTPARSHHQNRRTGARQGSPRLCSAPARLGPPQRQHVAGL